MERIRKSICILVKAYPQPSHKYGQTVCCAGITNEGEFVRLYPIPYMSLNSNQKFERFDWIEAEVWQDRNTDWRPESYKVFPDSIKVISKAASKEHHKLWLSYVSPSFQDLKDENHSTQKTSLGIVRPDPASLKFRKENYSNSSDDEKESINLIREQQLLFSKGDDYKIPPPETVFKYRFTSAKTKHDMTIHDWEVQAAYHKFKQLYRSEAFDKLSQKYQLEIPSSNLHFIMGTQLSRPHQFMIIGLLRFQGDGLAIEAQKGLF
ncbi:hypothetical protein [Neptunomonas sp.]|uniref:hypothetical protein n=1 Tax=Neptunomonas sp. TaxID=1971898 RepID=UPI0025D60BA9|nr:hypothetical protein [Neptunomonas sp.]